MAAKKKSDTFLESLMDTNLYSMGAYFSDRHPELVDEVIDQSVAIEERGLAPYAEDNELTVEECFQTLLTGLAVRCYKAVDSWASRSAQGPRAVAQSGSARRSGRRGPQFESGQPDFAVAGLGRPLFHGPAEGREYGASVDMSAGCGSAEPGARDPVAPGSSQDRVGGLQAREHG